MLPVVVTDPVKKTVLYINSAAAEFFKVDHQQVVGQQAVDYWHKPEQRGLYIEQLQKNGKVTNLEIELKTQEGAIRMVRLSGNITTFNGQKAISSIFQDITETRNAAKKLKQSEVRYHELYNLLHLLTDAVPDLIWAKDLEGRYIFSNKANRQKLLKSEDIDPIGKNHQFFTERERNNGYTYTFGEICADSDRIVIESGKPGQFMEKGRVRDEYLMLDVYKAPLLDYNGTLIGTVGVGRDITQEAKTLAEKKASDERYRLLAENVRDVIWTMDTKFRFNYLSPSLIDLVGYSPEEFTKSELKSHFPPKSLEAYHRFRMHYKKVQHLGQTYDDQQFWEFQIRQKDGSRIWVETITSLITDDNDEFLGIIGVTRDATSRVESQKELQKAKDDALSASRAKSEFLANMSHEIRTPMNGILGMLQLLKNSSLDPNQKKHVNTALQSGSSLLRLISDILDFSKIEAGKIELSKEKFHLRSFLEGVMQSFETLVDSEHTVMNLILPKRVPNYIMADKFRLQQILVNLLGNSVKFTEKGRISLRIESGPTQNGRTLLTFIIEDTGIGIPENRKQYLFEPFVQADGSFQRRYTGTGLGLSIVKQLVTLMDGEVALRSRSGYGTVVEFTIQSESCRQGGHSREATTHHDCNNVQSANILVVEDEKINGMVISAMLKNMGHKVALAENGKQALEVLAEKPFDCILMDIQMPEMDGLETAKAIRERKLPNDTVPPIIAVTAHAMKGDRETFLAAGMDEYITKPVDGWELLTTLERVLC